MVNHKNTEKDPNVAFELARYGSAGLIGTAVHYVILAELLKRTGFGVVFASTCGALAGTIVNYILHYFYTFRSRKDHRATFAKFWLIAEIGWGINAGLLFFNVQLFQIATIPAQLTTTAVTFLFSFVMNRRWTF